MDERSSACYCIFTRDQEAADFVAHYVTEKLERALICSHF